LKSQILHDLKKADSHQDMDDIECSQAQDELAVQIESLTHEDLAVWLNQCNIPQRFCTIFEGILVCVFRSYIA